MEEFFYALSKLISRILFLHNHLSSPDIAIGIKQPTKLGLALR